MQTLYPTKRIRKTNWNLCNCKSNKKIGRPKIRLLSERVLDAVIERATLNDGEYDEKRETHEYVLNQTLCEHQAFWH